MMTTTAWLRLTVSLITATVLVGCGGGTHVLGKSPDAAVAGGTTAVTGSGGTSAVDAPRGGVGGTSSDVGGAGMGGSVKSGGMSASAGAISSASAGAGGNQNSSAAGGSSASSASCCSTFECPSGYWKLGHLNSTCPAGAVCEIFTTSCGCNKVLCQKYPPVGGSGGAAGSGGSSGGAGGGGTITSGASSGSPCPSVPSCNWCNGFPVHGEDGCIYEYRCTNGIDPCSKSPCSDSSGCDVGYTCIEGLCWRGDAGVGGSGGTGGSGGSSGSSSTCMPPTSCNWCGGEMLKDANGCFAGYRCPNGADPCKTSMCSTSAPCPSGQTCNNMLCWPNDGGTGATLCGGKVCGADETCCGPAECGKCVNALSGQYCPTTCTTQACGPSGAPCKTGEVCLDLVYQTTTTRTGTASCQPNPCGSDTLSCTCAKSLCGTTNLSCTLADPATGAVVCSTK